MRVKRIAFVLYWDKYRSVSPEQVNSLFVIIIVYHLFLELLFCLIKLRFVRMGTTYVLFTTAYTELCTE